MPLKRDEKGDGSNSDGTLSTRGSARLKDFFPPSPLRGPPISSETGLQSVKDTIRPKVIETPSKPATTTFTYVLQTLQYCPVNLN